MVGWGQAFVNLQTAHPLSRSRPAMPSRIGAVVTTALAHLLVILALVEGLQQARAIGAHEVVVQFSPQVRKTQTPAPRAPVLALVKPVVENPQAPVIAIAPAPPAPVAAPAPPPMLLPSPPNSNAAGSNAGPSWEAALLSRLAAAKHYPPTAKAARQQGVVLLRFSMDRDGDVSAARVEKSSGVAALDQEALAALARAAPLPKPPEEVSGDVLDLVVPVDFF